MVYSEQKNTNKKLVIIGGGGHCKSVIDSASSLNEYSEMVITDPKFNVGDKIFGCKVVGDDEVLKDLYDTGYGSAFIALGSIVDTKLRRKLDRTITDIGFELPVIADPRAAIASESIISEGVYIARLACINAYSKIGRNAIINTGAIIEHDCQIGDYVHIAVGAVVCGGCCIENDVFVGANATIIQGIRIGENSIVGAGSTVLTDVPSDTKVVGLWK